MNKKNIKNRVSAQEIISRDTHAQKSAKELGLESKNNGSLENSELNCDNLSLDIHNIDANDARGRLILNILSTFAGFKKEMAAKAGGSYEE
jgi:hypothetical protein